MMNIVQKNFLEEKPSGEKRNNQIDFLKGLAIIAVILYHMDILTYGYLGVDLFLVINGYLITISILRSYDRGNFSYFKFLIKRIIRLWPLVLLAGIVSLAIGYFSMLPDDLENLGQSVVASNFFANNILSKITTRNYWAIGQKYKPLMHTWYLGIIVQFYVIYPLIVMLVHKFSSKFAISFRKNLAWVTAVLTAVSLGLNLTAIDTGAQFYYLQYRFFEMTIGGLFAVLMFGERFAEKSYRRFMQWLRWCVLALVLLFVININIVPAIIRLLLVVAFSVGAIISTLQRDARFERMVLYRCIVWIGTASYSIFICHQVILAMYRYIINAIPSWYENLLLLAIIAVVSVALYCFMEKKINPSLPKGQIAVFVSCVVVCTVSTFCGLYLYSVAGVVRDVPELSVYKNDIHRGMHAEYCDRVYGMDQDFSDDNRIKVLVIGDSFGRDWVNVLLESDIANLLDISYIYTGHLSENHIGRIARADYIFLRAETAVKGNFPDYLYDSISDMTKVYGIGTKQYGETNGNVYAHRKDDDYFTQTVSYDTVKVLYMQEKECFGKNYIDFIEPVIQSDGKVRVFTDEGQFISQDCRHLTKSGAQYYSRVFDLKGLFNID